ncbi:CXXC motif containing zinc binding protein isoform X2 [Dermacentor silvarum]|uniref:CXXC motif containing zinc binding protein isoform X2 n=1 Tax=Dermacentor silvarum TaxID=543639 RepID=UPI002100EE52|nr:CXXC motif containing zinc binding protein isoform X2 [Dermacentor silvarum]
MVKIALQLRANLDNVAHFKPCPDCVWHLRLKCMNCGEQTSAWQTVEAANRSPMKGSRGDANLVLKCKLCSRENSMDVLNEKIQAYDAESSSQFVTVIVFECRGVEPVAFDARDGFTATAAESGTIFDEVKFESREWADYDEQGKQAVGIYDLEHKFIKVK